MNMVRRTGQIMGVALIGIILLATPASANSQADEVAQQVLCQCGCNLSVANCAHQECSSRDAMKKLIVEKLDSGMSETQVIQYFVSQYGEQVLVSPPKKGFNLVAWITPFAVILIGALVVWLALKKWVWRGKIEVQSTTTAEDPEDEEYRLRLEQDLKKFGEGGYR